MDGQAERRHAGQRGGVMDHDAIQSWLVTHLASELHLSPESLDVRVPLTFYGLDSLTAAGLSGELEDWLGRPLSPTLLSDHVTIESIARHLASSEHADPADRPATLTAEVAEVAEESPKIIRERTFAGWNFGPRVLSESADVGRDFRLRVKLRRTAIALAKAVSPGEAGEPGRPLEWTRGQLRLLRMVRAAVGLVSIVDAQGQEAVPRRGPLVLAVNHLHILDALWFFSVLPRRAAFLVAEEFGRMPLLGRLLDAGDPIYIRRGQSDRRALDRAVAVLAAGGAVAIAPEGRLSRTRGLIQGRTGVAYLAAASGAPVMPLVAYGQERAGWHWRRLRRVAVHVRFGAPISVPPGKATAKELEQYTNEIMTAMALALPPHYRGVYGNNTRTCPET
jgi:1-acyl-sn-glycerol-3-phosphate acyltransferase